MCHVGTAYLWWLVGLFCLCGLHRFYLGKPFTGLLWLFTLGLLGVGQVIDLFRIKGMVRRANAKTFRNAPNYQSLEAQHSRHG